MMPSSHLKPASAGDWWQPTCARSIESPSSETSMAYRIMFTKTREEKQLKLLTHISSLASELVFTEDYTQLTLGSKRETVRFKSGASCEIVDCAALEWKHRVPEIDACSWSICITLRYQRGQDIIAMQRWH